MYAKTAQGYYTLKSKKVFLYTDGGSRGNPGPAGIGVVILDSAKKRIKDFYKYIGETTNNVAEYNGVISAIEWLLKKNNSHSQLPVTFLLDSELVVKQINGFYKVKDENLRNLFFEIMTKIKLLGGHIIFKHVPREENIIADKLVNDELNSL